MNHMSCYEPVHKLRSSGEVLLGIPIAALTRKWGRAFTFMAQTGIHVSSSDGSLVIKRLPPSILWSTQLPHDERDSTAAS